MHGANKGRQRQTVLDTKSKAPPPKGKGDTDEDFENAEDHEERKIRIQEDAEKKLKATLKKGLRATGMEAVSSRTKK